LELVPRGQFRTLPAGSCLLDVFLEIFFAAASLLASPGKTNRKTNETCVPGCRHAHAVAGLDWGIGVWLLLATASPLPAQPALTAGNVSDEVCTGQGQIQAVTVTPLLAYANRRLRQGSVRPSLLLGLRFA
jgi:hypothetical protein